MTLHEFVQRSLAIGKALPYHPGSDELPIGSTWGVGPVGHHRDSDSLARSNWTVILTDLQTRFPDDVEVLRFGHWAVGWVEEIAFRALDAGGRPTPAASAAYVWHERLEAYPVADEAHWSALVEAEESEA